VKRLEPVVAALVLALLTLAMFHPLLQGRWLEGDVAEEYWPDLVVLCRGLAEHHIPRWLPFEHGGTPFYADPQAGVYYPLNHAMCLLAGPSPSIHWADARVVLHFFVAGACMTLFLRREKLTLPGALFGGALFEMSPFFRHDWELNLTWGFAWFPLVLFAISAMCRTPTLLRGSFVALAVALVVSVGSPPAAFFALLGAALFAVFRVVTALRAGANRRDMALAILAAIVIAACVLPMMLVPTWELTKNSVQSAHDFSVTSDGGDAHMLGVLVPWLDDHHYVSIFAVVLAPFAFAGRWPLRWFFAGLGLFALFMIAGTHTPFYRLAYAIVPGVSLFRDPTRYSSLWGASLAALAAAGFDRRVRVKPLTISIAFVAFAFVDLFPYFVENRHTRPWPIAENRATEDSLRAMGADLIHFRTYDEFGIGMRSGSRDEQRDLRGYQDPLTIGRYGKMLGMLEEKPELLGTFNVRWVLYGPHYMMGDWHHFIPDPAKGAWAVQRAPHVWEIPNALPDAFFMDGAEIAKDEDDALDRLAAIAPAPKIVIESGDAPLGTATFVPAEEAIENERVTADVNAPSAGFVLVNETYYPGWVATIDGEPAPILRANAFVRAVRVRAGKHHIVMEFRPWQPRVLEPLALVAIAFVAVAAIFATFAAWRASAIDRSPRRASALSASPSRVTSRRRRSSARCRDRRR
jgi:hypothetical protein